MSEARRRAPGSPRLAAAAAGAVLALLAALSLANRLAPVVEGPGPTAWDLGGYLRHDYLSMGRNLRREGRLRVDGDGERHSAHRALLAPSFVGLLHFVFDEPAAAGVVRAQAVLAGLCVLSVFALGCAAHSPAAGLAASALFAFSPSLAWSASEISVEWLQSFALLGAACWLLLALREPGRERLLGLGLALGLGLCVRSSLLAPAAALLGAGALLRRRLGWSGGDLAGAGVLVLAVLLPWGARNAARFGELAPFERGSVGELLFAASTGRVGLVGTVEEFDALGRLADRQLAPGSCDTPLECRRALAARALANILEDPVGYASSTLRRAWWPLPRLGWLLAAGLAGLLLRRRDPAQWGLAVLVGSLLFVQAPLAVTDRYFVPSLPLLQVWASVGAAALLESARARLPGGGRPGTPAAAALGPARWAAGVHASVLLALYVFGASALAAEHALARRTAPAERLEDSDDWEGAEREWSRLVDGSPGDWRFRLWRGQARETLGRWDAACEDFEAAKRARPKDPEPLLRLASVRLAQGRPAEAYAAYARAGALAARTGIPHHLQTALAGSAAAAARGPAGRPAPLYPQGEGAGSPLFAFRQDFLRRLKAEPARELERLEPSPRGRGEGALRAEAAR